MRTHGLSGSCFEKDPLAIRLDKKRVQIQRQPVGRQEGAPQYVLQLCLRRIAGVYSRRAAEQPVAQHGRRDVADAKAVIAGISTLSWKRRGGSSLPRGHAGRQDHSRDGRRGCQHDLPTIQSNFTHTFDPVKIADWGAASDFGVGGNGRG